MVILWMAVVTVNAETSATELSNILKSIHSLRANFIQTVYDNRGKAIQHSNGRMALQRPGKFRWEVMKPIPQLIIANGSRLWIYDQDLQQVTIRSLSKTSGETPALLLSHVNTFIEKDFTVQTLSQKSMGEVWFSLKPKKPDNMFSFIEMGFLNKQIHEMRFKNNLGHRTLIQFKNLNTNVRLAASLFYFKSSTKIDVIDETKEKNG
jgi:outer membrane lipoprotein carrier protein